MIDVGKRLLAQAHAQHFVQPHLLELRAVRRRGEYVALRVVLERVALAILARVDDTGYRPYMGGIRLTDGRDIADVSAVAAAISKTVHDTMVFVPVNVREACEVVVRDTLS